MSRKFIYLPAVPQLLRFAKIIIPVLLESDNPDAYICILLHNVSAWRFMLTSFILVITVSMKSLHDRLHDCRFYITSACIEES